VFNPELAIRVWDEMNKKLKDGETAPLLDTIKSINSSSQFAKFMADCVSSAISTHIEHQHPIEAMILATEAATLLSDRSWTQILCAIYISATSLGYQSRVAEEQIEQLKEIASK
jgi:hypothetical protein